RFRELEAEVLESLGLKRGDVVATGGGLPCREGRMARLRALGTVVWLKGDFGEMYERARGAGLRPMLAERSRAEVEALYREREPHYRAAGADCIETNTFGANRFKLAVHGLGSQVREINLRGVKLARDVREAMGRDVLVLGSMGPLGKYLAPLGTLGEGEARDAFREQAEGLLEGGVDAFVVETMSDLGEVALAVEAIRAVADLPIVAQVAFTDEGLTFLGRTPAEVARALSALPVQVIGANCSVGSSTLYEVLEQMRPAA